jgi:hypothetical protein
MSSIETQAAVLTAHPSSRNEALRRLEVRLRAPEPDMLVLHYALEADMSRVRVPAPGAGARADGLWKHTCFEAFLAPGNGPGVATPVVDAPGVDAPGVATPGVATPGVVTPRVGTQPCYFEFNFSPSLDWAVYRFAGYREGMSRAEIARAPALSVRRSEQGLELESVLRLGGLEELCEAPHLRIALAAVIEDGDGRLFYWGLEHPPGKPDFHHPSAFALEVIRA